MKDPESGPDSYPVVAITLNFAQAKKIAEALDVARDAIQPVTVAQMRLHGINPNTAQMLDEAMDVICPLLGMKLRKL